MVMGVLQGESGEGRVKEVARVVTQGWSRDSGSGALGITGDMSGFRLISIGRRLRGMLDLRNDQRSFVYQQNGLSWQNPHVPAWVDKLGQLHGLRLARSVVLFHGHSNQTGD